MNKIDTFNDKHFVKRDCCPVCFSVVTEQLYTIPYSDQPIQSYLKSFYEPQGKVELQFLEGNNYTLNECKECALVYQVEVPNDELLVRLYESWIDPDLAFERNRDLGLEYRLTRLNEIVRIVDYFDKPTKDLKFLDFGMGWGSYCLQLNSLDISSYGAELSEQRIENAKKNGVQVIHWDEIPERELDFINTDDVFEHLVDPNSVLEHLTKGLKRGGLIRLAVPNGIVAKGALKKMDWAAPRGTEFNLNAVSPLEHLNCFSPKSLRKLAEQHNLTEVKIPYKRRVPLKNESLLNRVKAIYRRRILGIASTELYFMKG